MLRTVFVDHVWVALLFLTALSVFDYQLSILGMRWYRRGADAHYDLGGSYELNPPFEKDVEDLRPVSPRHMILTARTAVLVFGVWWFTAHMGRLEDLYVAVLGFFILVQVPTQIRHVNNLALFRYVALRGGVEGRTHTPRWLDLRLSGLLFWMFAVVFLVFWLIVGDALFIGGTVGCLLVGSRFWIFGEEKTDLT